jgi:succinate dehydrogenase (ubiquinone) membrane anchor subunit
MIRSFLAPTITRRAPTALIAGTYGRRCFGGGPQIIQGTVNDAVPIPPEDRSHGSFHWSFERLVAVGLVPIVIAPFAAGSLSPVLDATLGSLLIVHSHIGFESCIIDYIPKRNSKTLHNLARYALYSGSALALIGLYEFETNDVGLSETLRKVWNA